MRSVYKTRGIRDTDETTCDFFDILLSNVFKDSLSWLDLPFRIQSEVTLVYLYVIFKK